MDYLQKIKNLEEDTPKTQAEWMQGWRELAEVTSGISTQDPRFERFMRWLDVADAAFALDSWSDFQEAARMLKEVAKEKL